jgi:hypothetical protein
MMLLTLVHRHPPLFWPLLAPSIALLAGGAIVLT